MLVIETDRLQLREFVLEDSSALSAVLGDAEVMKFGPGIQSLQEIQYWLADAINQYKLRGFGPWAVTRKDSETLLGYCGLFYFADLAGSKEIEIGYRFARSQWGHGYATEAAAAVREHAFNQLRIARLVAMIDPGNTASLRVAEKLGMHYKKEIMLEGYTHPDYLYEIINPLADDT